MQDKSPHGDSGYPSPRYAWYVVGVLMLLYVFSMVDRQILSLLVEPNESVSGSSSSPSLNGIGETAGAKE